MAVCGLVPISSIKCRYGCPPHAGTIKHVDAALLGMLVRPHLLSFVRLLHVGSHRVKAVQLLLEIFSCRMFVPVVDLCGDTSETRTNTSTSIGGQRTSVLESASSVSSNVVPMLRQYEL